MKRLTAIFICLILLAAAPLTATADSWERVENLRDDPAESERIDVTVRDGYVYVVTNRTVTVKVCTILGQVVSQSKVQPGIWRIKLRQRGVYILKAGPVTKRVNI